MRVLTFILTITLLGEAASAQTAEVRPAARHELPTHIDGNTSAFWKDGQLHLLSSTGNPVMLSSAAEVLGPWTSVKVDTSRLDPMRIWMEAAWMDADGVLFLWYHHEPEGSCPGRNGITAPKIGAALSYDGGLTIVDLGIVLESGDPLDCSAKNGFFAGGHGDFSVILDPARSYFYFLFTNYGGPVEQQGIVMARLAVEERYQPAGAVRKYYNGNWDEPGIGGRMTPALPAAKSWQRTDIDSYWGPSVHWNTFLETHVVLLNRACCEPDWPQEGIYYTFISDLANPGSWTSPKKLLSPDALPKAPGYYPQVLGLQPGGTDTLAGEVARLYVHGVSDWEIVFKPHNPEAGGEDPGPCDNTSNPDECNVEIGKAAVKGKSPILTIKQ